MVRLPRRISGLSASALRRNCETSEAIRCAAPRTLGSSTWPACASAVVAASRIAPRTQVARSGLAGVGKQDFDYGGVFLETRAEEEPVGEADRAPRGRHAEFDQSAVSRY